MSDLTYVNCSACGQASKSTQQSQYPDNGFALSYDHFGYYGGFSDNLDVALSQHSSNEWIMCHDCVVKFFDTFPMLEQEFGYRHHPCSNDIPCCRFAWRGTALFGKRHDEILVRTQTPVLDIATDTLVWQDDEPC